MKRIAIAMAVALVFPAGAGAQPKDDVIMVEPVQATVRITKVDPATRTVTFRGPRGMQSIQVPPESQNFDQVKVGSGFRVTYIEPVAIEIAKSSAAAGASTPPRDRFIQLAPKGAAAGGTLVRTQTLTGQVDAVDHTNRLVAVRGPGGEPVSMKLAADAGNLDQIRVGDTVTVTYAQAIATEMIPQPGPAPVGG